MADTLRGEGVLTATCVVMVAVCYTLGGEEVLPRFIHAVAAVSANPLA